MTYKEFREMSRGVYEWEVFLIRDLNDHWYYGKEALNPEFDDKRVVSFELKSIPRDAHDIVCVVDLI